MASEPTQTKPTGFDDLYRRHRAEIYRYLLRGLRSPEDAEDVTQVAFLDAYRALQRNPPPERPRAWLYAVAQNAYRRTLRRELARPTSALDEETATAPEVEAVALELLESLRQLPPRQRAAFLLREVEGLTYDEIASRLDDTVPAVQMQLHRARNSLREDLRDRRTAALAGPLTWLAQLSRALETRGDLLAKLTPAAAALAAAATLGSAGAGAAPEASGTREERAAAAATAAPVTAPAQKPARTLAVDAAPAAGPAPAARTGAKRQVRRADGEATSPRVGAASATVTIPVADHTGAERPASQSSRAKPRASESPQQPTAKVVEPVHAVVGALEPLRAVVEGLDPPPVEPPAVPPVPAAPPVPALSPPPLPAQPPPLPPVPAVPAPPTLP